MDKKSFIRGFGTGVLFSAVVLGISFTVRTSDSYVTSRAKELGMVYQSTDSDLELAKASPKASEQPDVKVTQKPVKKSTPTPSKTPVTTPAATAVPKATAKPEKKDTASDTKKRMEAEKKKMEENLRNEAKYLTINAGDWSSDVSAKLAALGVIKDAKDFDKYLNDNGYSSSISAGTYKVSIDDTYNELARKITGK